ncbi:MAG TPA: hypothetical protein VKB71_16655, partial [Rhizomicrobium sp.]|nr:hypothetical protein [Rhizomicrobium sp.]
VIQGDRAAAAQCASACGAVVDRHALEEIQELRLEAALRLDFQAARFPIHELDVAQVGHIQLQAAIEDAVQHRLDVGARLELFEKEGPHGIITR